MFGEEKIVKYFGERRGEWGVLYLSAGHRPLEIFVTDTAAGGA